MPNTVEQQLISQLQDVHAMEEHVLRSLDAMITTSNDASVIADFKRHKTETEKHRQRIETLLNRRDASRSLLADAMGVVGELAMLPIDMFRSHPTAHNVRDAYATEHMEIAAYEMLERTAELAGDDDVIQAARLNRADDEKMAKKIAGNWDRFAIQALEESGVAVIEPPASLAHVTTARKATGTGARRTNGSKARSKPRKARAKS